MDPGTHARTGADRAEQALRRRAEAAVADWVAHANALLSAPAAGWIDVPAVRFDLRGRAAGQTVYPRRRRESAVIRLNAALLTANPQDMIEETVPHEVAHVATWWLHGARVKPHGPEWRATMRAFGKTPTTCHALPAAPARRVTYHPYACACPRENYLSAIRHRRAQRNRQRYRCTRCGAELRYTGGPARRGHPDEPEPR